MMLPLKDILDQHKIDVYGVIHIGAHYAEEHEEYIKCGATDFVYVEPCKESFKVLLDKFLRIDNKGIKLFNCACGAEEKTDVMYVSENNEGQSNSLLEPKGHLTQHPEVKFDDAEVVLVKKLDNLQFDKSKYNLLAMDVQGYEGEVLKGATETLQNIDVIYTEVNNGETYSGNILIDEMDEYLDKFGFIRVETFFPSPNWSWGDSVYISRRLL